MFYFSIKQSCLADHSNSGHKCPVFEWLWQPSSFDHSKTDLTFSCLAGPFYRKEK
jgi:hypothetical protein